MPQMIPNSSSPWRERYLQRASLFPSVLKKQHVQLIHQYQKKPLHENPAQTYLKPFYTDLYTQNECAAEEKLDLFSFINTKASTQTELIIKILTPAMRQGEHCAVEEPEIGVGCWAKQATHHAVKSWWEARA